MEPVSEIRHLMRIAAAIVMVLALSPSAFAMKRGAAVIEPGYRVDVLELGMPVDVAIRTLGGVKADSVNRVTYKCDETVAGETWLIFKARGLALAFNKDKSLVRISVTNRGYVTQRGGIRVGTGAFNVSDAFGPPNGLSDQEFKKTLEHLMREGEWNYAEEGISFSVKGERVTAITVFWRNYDPCAPKER